jgi:hypothetical protein
MAEIKPEKEPSREQLMNESKKIIYSNLLHSGLAKRVFEASLPGQTFSSESLNRVDFDFVMSKDGICICPRLYLSRVGAQPFTIKLHRLCKSEAERKKYAEQVWIGIDETHKQALIETALNWKTVQNKTAIENARIHAEEMGRAMAERSKSESENHLRILSTIRKAITNGTLRENIDDESAFLWVEAKRS